MKSGDKMGLINLLPLQAKTDIKYARRNHRLVTYCVIMLLVIAGIGVVTAAGSFYIDNNKKSLQKSIDETSSTIQTEKLADVQKDVTSLSSGIKLVAQILQKEIRFSKLLQQIGATIPTKAVLTQIVLSETINNALDLTARAADYQTATQVQINLQDPANKLFDKVDTVSVNCTEPGTDTQAADAALNKLYPCTIQMRALFKKDASFLFVNGPSAAKATP